METLTLTETELKVFNGVKAIAMEDDFAQARMTFITANCSQFDTTEENKLEYTEIHNEYLKITENILEAQVKERFQVTDDEMNAFYAGFKHKFKLYEALSVETVDVLFSLLDFGKFKELMIQAKNQANEKAVNDITPEARQNWIDSTEKVLGTTYAEFKKIYDEDLSTWAHKFSTSEKQFQKQGWKVNVYQRKQEGAPNDLLRIDAVLKGKFGGDKCLDFWKNGAANSSMIKEQSILETFPNGDWVMYFRFKLPLMTDRDNVCLVHSEPVEDGGTYILCQTVERADKPEVKGVIRMFQQVTSLIRPDPSNPEQTLYTEIDSFNMKGSIPIKLMNMVIASETAKEFKGFWNYINK